MKKSTFMTGILLLLLLCGKLTGQCPGMQTFTTDGTWTAPSTGGPWEVEITCNGAGGGNATDNGRTGGSGAKTIGIFSVNDGEVLNIIVGKKGNNNTGMNGGGGGGGGSAVINCSNPSNCAGGTLLIAAAGGGGAGSAGNGGAGQGTQGNGDPGTCVSAGCGGGINGICSTVGCLNINTRGGAALLTGTSTGGIASNNGGNGGNGFGGGGAGRFSVGGGGGGHSGGDCGIGGGGTLPGIGGESYNSGSSQTNTNGGGANANTDGSVVINCLGVLPVEMKAFTVKRSGNFIRLSWQTASESNNEGFEVQHSNDARQWQPLAFVTGQGTSNQSHFYEYTDAQPSPGINYYRLKQTDFDGHFDYSPIVSADFRNLQDFGNLRFFPNPVRQGITSLYFPEAPETEGFLEIFDHMGRQVFYQKIKPEGDGQSVPVSLFNCPPGIYTARLELRSEVRTERLVIAK
jgi:hypothetical protein